MSRVESVSHYEIKLEQYSNLVNIEALTMLNMARSLILPAVNSYAADVAANIAVKKDLGAPCRTESKLLKQLCEGADEIGESIEGLDRAHNAMVATKDLLARANVCRDEVLPAMERLRACADAMELICSKDAWPLPSYNDILFYL